VIYTVGHSTRSLETFLALLAEYHVRHLVDVRRYPASRRYPHFAGEPLTAALGGAGIAYRHDADLGGRRPARADSVNTAWRSASFRGYADYMETAAFEQALARLIADVPQPVAIMCAEAVPWRCHRQLIADALVARGIPVRHILGAGEARDHRLSPHAQLLADGRIRYAAAPDQPSLW
jgi:uncharacterized protein (DUF488 family)